MGKKRSKGKRGRPGVVAARALPPERVVVLDFGSQYTQLIARRVRELGVYSEILPYHTPVHQLSARAAAVILSGGPASVQSQASPLCDRRLFDLGLPILGICYGQQLMARMLGGKLAAAEKREYGHARLHIRKKGLLFRGIDGAAAVWMSHGDSVTAVPPAFEVLASTSSLPVAAMADRRRRFYGVQFHPEVVHTSCGKEILSNFLFRIARCSGGWTMKSFLHTTLDELRGRVGNEKVLCAVSGGVDSSVLAALLHAAVGEQLACIFINNGLLRKGEARDVPRMFMATIGVRAHRVNASEAFLRALKGVADPEHKRRIIGNTFIRIFEREAKRLGRFRFLAQGTLYPDVVESLSPLGGPSATIKTHHNVGGLPSRMNFALIEPFRFLFKDEVRRIGKELGLPDELVWRHPFPGPGLAVRIVGPVTRRRLRVLRAADAILNEELKRTGYYRKTWQAFTVLLPVKAVGVMGDQRTYANVVTIRAVTSRDGMTADWAKLPPKILGSISNRIINEVEGINRVVYDVSSKPPATIEWE